MTHSIVKFVLPLLAALGAGCTTMGIGSGATPAGADSVRFGWNNSDSVAGTLGTSLSDGEAYSGQLFQITRDTTVDNAGPLWTGWHLRWGGSGGLGYRDSVPVTGFTMHYPITDRTTSLAVVPDSLAGDARCTVTAFSIEAEADAQDLGNTSTPLAPVTNWRNCGAAP